MGLNPLGDLWVFELGTWKWVWIRVANVVQQCSVITSEKPIAIASRSTTECFSVWQNPGHNIVAPSGVTQQPLARHLCLVLLDILPQLRVSLDLDLLGRVELVETAEIHGLRQQGNDVLVKRLPFASIHC